MKKSTMLILVLAFVSAWVVMAAGVAAVWLTDEVRVFGLVLLPAMIVASLLVVYFDWRARLQRRIVAEREAHRDVQEAA